MHKLWWGLGLATSVAALAWAVFVLVFGSESGDTRWLFRGYVSYAVPVLLLWAIWSAWFMWSLGYLGADRLSRWVVAVPSLMVLLLVLTFSGVTFRARFELSKQALDGLVGQVNAEEGRYVEVDRLVGLFWVYDASPAEAGAVTAHSAFGSLRYDPNRPPDAIGRIERMRCTYVRSGWWNCDRDEC